MATVRDLLKGSLRLIGAISPGETPSAQEQVDALSALNDMLDSWSIEKLMIYGIVREELSLVAGTQSYTIGAGGTFNTTRPIHIERATIENQSANPTVETELDILTTEEWAAITVKDLTADVPRKLYVEKGASLDTLYFWPKPSAANKFVPYSKKALTTLAVGDTVTFPPGYAEAIRYNLAVKLAPEYGKELSPLILQGAIDGKALIKKMNIRPFYLGTDEALTAKNAVSIEAGK